MQLEAYTIEKPKQRLQPLQIQGMKRVYRLLRNNIEYGPYTIDELLGQSLRASDMLWIEGESQAWSRLSEIELKTSQTVADEPASTRGRRDEIEEKAEQLRKKVLVHRAAPQPVVEEIVSRDETHYFIPTPDDDTIELVDHRRRRSTIVGDVLMTGVIVTLFAGGLYGGRALFLPKNSTVSNLEKASIGQSDEHAAKALTEIPETTTVIPIATTDSSRFVDSAAFQKMARKTFVAAHTQNDSAAADAAGNATPVTAIDVPAPNTEAPADTAQKKEEAKKVELKKPEPRPVKEDTVVEEETEKKKGFLRKLFGRKNKED